MDARDKKVRLRLRLELKEGSIQEWQQTGQAPGKVGRRRGNNSREENPEASPSGIDEFDMDDDDLELQSGMLEAAMRVDAPDASSGTSSRTSLNTTHNVKDHEALSETESNPFTSAQDIRDDLIDPQLLRAAEEFMGALGNDQPLCAELEDMALDVSQSKSATLPLDKLQFIEEYSMINLVRYEHCSISDRNSATYLQETFKHHNNKSSKDDATVFVLRCPYEACTYTIHSHTVLDMHMAACQFNPKHLQPEKPYVCTVEGCEYRARTEAALKSHGRIQHPERPFTPRSCDKETCDSTKVYDTMQAWKAHGTTKAHRQTQRDQSWEARKCVFPGCKHPRVFIRRWDLYSHLLLKHEISKEGTKLYLSKPSFIPGVCSVPGCTAKPFFTLEHRFKAHLATKAHQGMTEDQVQHYLSLRRTTVEPIVQQ